LRRDVTLQAVLRECDRHWRGDAPAGADGQVTQQAIGSALGRRLLLRGLPAEVMDGLFAPTPGTAAGAAILARWPRARVQALVRDLGILAHAPMIRAEVRREPVRWLRRVLGNGYLLALDRTVWDGRIGRDVEAGLVARWETLLGAPGFLVAPALLGDLLDRQGRAELQAWAGRRNRALADWSRLLHAPEPALPAHLPEKALLVVMAHHEGRDSD
jgi:hypothetical protein